MKEFGERADAVVLGGGVVGLAIARELGRRGLSVVVVERGRALGAEASSAAAGMLAPQAEADRRDDFFELACASRDLYPAFAEALREETGTDIELERTGTLYVALNKEDTEEIERRYLWQKNAGLEVQRLEGQEARAVEPQLSTHVQLTLRFPLDGQVENRLLVAALAKSVAAMGARVLMETEAKSVILEGGRAVGVETSSGKISAGAVVIACGAWSSFIKAHDERASVRDGSPMVQVEPVRGQMLCFDGSAVPLVRHVIYSPRGYLVPRRDGRLLAGTTTERAGFKKAVTLFGLNSITTHALEIAPAIGGLALMDSWAGLRPKGADEWPVLGACEEVDGLFFATGHFRNGILLAPLTGALIAEMISTGATPPMLKAFTPERVRRTASCAG